MIKMRLHNGPFNLVGDGHKTIEARLNDEKRKLVRIGDIVEFSNRKTDEKIKVKVIDLLSRDSFEELLKSHDISEFGSNNKNIFLSGMHEYYTKEKIKKCGVLGIRFERINNND